MKKFLTIALLALMSASTLSAVSKVSQGADALKGAKADGIMVFHYAADWDRYSKRRCDELMQDASIAKAAGSAVYMLYPAFEDPTDAQKKQLEKLRDKIQIVRPLTYPAIQMFNAQGYRICNIEGRDITATENADIAKIVAAKLDAYKQQTALVNKANAANGVEKAKLMGQACRIEGIQYPENALKIIEEADPEDKSGYIVALKANDYGLSSKVREMEMDAAIAYVDSIINDEKYTAQARQGAIAGLLALWRNKGTMAQVALMKKYCNLSIALNPNYYHAKSANQIKTLWLKEFTADSGWFKAMLPADTTPVEMKGKIPIQAAGTYTITMIYTGGSDGLTTKSITLYDGATRVAEDVHNGFAGHNPVNNVYTLTVPKTVKKPSLVFVFNQGESRNSYGRIEIKKK